MFCPILWSKLKKMQEGGGSSGGGYPFIAMTTVPDGINPAMLTEEETAFFEMALQQKTPVTIQIQATGGVYTLQMDFESFEEMGAYNFSGKMYSLMLNGFLIINVAKMNGVWMLDMNTDTLTPMEG